MEKKRISIIIPAHNAEKTLEHAVRQLKPDEEADQKEILIVENGSSDRTFQIARELETRYAAVSCFQSETGVSNARNFGLLNASGEWITFLDADDWIDAAPLWKLLERADVLQADIVMGDMYREIGNTQQEESYCSEEFVAEDDKKQAFELDIFKPQTGVGFIWGKLFRSAFLKRHGLLLRPELSAAEDAEFMLRAVHAAEKAAYCPILFYHYWYNPDSAVRKYHPKYPERYEKAMRQIDRDIEGWGEPYEQAYHSFVLYHLLLIAVNYSFHPEDGLTQKEQLRRFSKLLKKAVYAGSLCHVRYQDFSWSRKITLFMIKHRQYRIVRMIANIRHRQLRRK